MYGESRMPHTCIRGALFHLCFPLTTSTSSAEVGTFGSWMMVLAVWHAHVTNSRISPELTYSLTLDYELLRILFSIPIAIHKRLLNRSLLIHLTIYEYGISSPKTIAIIPFHSSPQSHHCEDSDLLQIVRLVLPTESLPIYLGAHAP